MFFVSVFSARETKAKINTRSYIKPKISGTAKETSWKQKCNQLNIRCLQIIPLIWVNIQNTFIQLKSKQTTWIKTGERTQTGHFPKEDTQTWRGTWKDAQHHQSKCKSKPQQDVTSHLSKWLSSNRGEESVGQAVKKPHALGWWECKSVLPLRKTVQRFLKKKPKSNYHMIQKVHSGYISEVNKNSNSKRYTHPAKVYGSFIYNSQDMETIQVSINRRTDIQDAGCVGVCRYTHTYTHRYTHIHTQWNTT